MVFFTIPNKLTNDAVFGVVSIFRAVVFFVLRWVSLQAMVSTLACNFSFGLIVVNAQVMDAHSTLRCRNRVDADLIVSLDLAG